jgi:hypothetical protein
MLTDGIFEKLCALLQSKRADEFAEVVNALNKLLNAGTY